MMDAASGGAIVSKTPTEARELISTMAANSQACGICTSLAHPTDVCPTLHDEIPENVNAIGFQQRQFDPYSNTYNPGWRSHPNFSYANSQPTQQNYYQRPPPPQQPSGSGLGPLTSTGVIIQLADRSIVYPEGVLEDVLVQVNGLIFPADFFVIDMENDSSSNSSDILLGRPFLSTAKAKIDVHSGSLTLEFDGQVVKFNVYDAMKHAENVSCVYNVDIIEDLTHEASALNYDDELNYASCHRMSVDGVKRFTDRSEVSDDILDEAPKLELKTLPEHLKYAYLGDGETLPVIVSSMLDDLEEEKLIRVLREYREAIGGTIVDFQHRNEDRRA
ncbi:hypothetical protein K2173_018086 [Erythroxylum novogranatense]|uniref:Reverse transcriptase domain-containing protein n=1 Tax=Erythroxylum novogranatense TaxID=1862640 RepID=A0AAV8TXM3_9ROSI|nr:hypothetical protein K2173_018086 [Erythroxylum novogranatense]